MVKLLAGYRKLFLNYIAIASVLLVLSNNARADLSLTIELENQLQPKGEIDSVRTFEKTELSVLLGGSYFHFVGDGEAIFDFNKKKIYSITRDKGIYSSMSLYANVGFRDYELQNRRFLSDVLEKSGVQNNPAPIVFSEHELSVQVKGSKPDIKRNKHNGYTVFLGSGEEMLMVGGSIIDVPKKYTKEFVRFFRHRFGGHPSIIGEIVTSSGIYREITIWHKNVNEKIISLRIKSIKEIPSSSYSLEGLEAYTATNNRLLKLMSRLQNAPIEQRINNEKRILADAGNLISKNDPVGAMLAYLEYALMTGTQNLPWSDADRALLLKSDDVKRILAATENPKTREEAIARINVLETFIKKKYTGAHVLKIFEANALATVGNSDAARDYMFEALEMNPYIVGAWKDLGDLYFRSYSPSEAWLCWDTARKISPNHPMLQAINDYENRLQAGHPEFF